MKKFNLVLSIVITLFIFSIPFVSGQDSGSETLGISTFIFRIITELFPNNSIVFTSFSIVINILIFIGLGLSWFFSARSWNLSLMRLLLIGLMITSIDKIIQLLYIGDSTSFLNTLLIDFVPFMLVSILAFVLNHDSEVKSVNISKTLEDLRNGNINPKEAYKEMYSSKAKKMFVTNNAHFLKLRIVVPEEGGVNKFLRVLFFLPIPLGVVRFAFIFVKDEHLKESPFTKQELLEMINSKNINVSVNTTDKTKVIIKTI